MRKADMCAPERYWIKRIRSKAFKRALTDAVATELTSLAGEPVRNILGPELIQALIAEWDSRVLNPVAIADLAIAGNRRATRRLRRRRDSLSGLLGARLLDDFDALLGEFAELPPNAEDLIRNLMQQEFVHRLLTDLIFTAIVNFNQKVNPLFGALTVRALEEQIKGFIRLFMPMLQQQAIAFATSERNQRLVLDLMRAVTLRLLDEPLRHYLLRATPAQRRKADAFVRRAATDTKLIVLVRDAALAIWEDLYDTIRLKRVGELVPIERNSRWLAERCVEIVLPALARPSLLRLVTAELSLAATAVRPHGPHR